MLAATRLFHHSVIWCALHMGAAIAFPCVTAYAQGGATPSHRILGTVHDSIANAPLGSALVQLISRSNPAWARSTTSGSDGRFLFDSVPPGAYELGYLHPRLDSMHVVPPARTVQLPGADSSVRLAVPSFATLARAACPDSPLADDEALFVGRLWPARAGAPVSAGIVSVQWAETVIDGGVQQRRPLITAETDANGAFVICGVPVATRTLVQGVSADGASGLVELEAPATGLLLRDLRTAPVDRVSTAASTPQPIADSADAVIDSTTQLRGVGRLRGVIRTANGEPIARARLQVRESVAGEVSNADGSFELRGLPVGTHAIEALAVGYTPLRQAVDITEADTARLILTMTPVDLTLDAVRVLGERAVPAWKREFEGRRRQGMGRFIDDAAIARRNPMMVTDLLAGVPGVAIRAGAFTSQSQLLLNRVGGGLCNPDVVVDGMFVELAGMGVDAFVPASRLVGVEIYRGYVLRPSEFPIRRSCGLIVLWTGDREQQPD